MKKNVPAIHSPAYIDADVNHHPVHYFARFIFFFFPFIVCSIKVTHEANAGLMCTLVRAYGVHAREITLERGAFRHKVAQSAVFYQCDSERNGISHFGALFSSISRRACPILVKSSIRVLLYSEMILFS